MMAYKGQAYVLGRSTDSSNLYSEEDGKRLRWICNAQEPFPSLLTLVCLQLQWTRSTHSRYVDF